MFLMVLGTHNLAYGSLIVLQLPLHLFIVTKKSYCFEKTFFNKSKHFIFYGFFSIIYL